MFYDSVYNLVLYAKLAMNSQFMSPPLKCWDFGCTLPYTDHYLSYFFFNVCSTFLFFLKQHYLSIHHLSVVCLSSMIYDDLSLIIYDLSIPIFLSIYLSNIYLNINYLYHLSIYLIMLVIYLPIYLCVYNSFFPIMICLLHYEPGLLSYSTL